MLTIVNIGTVAFSRSNVFEDRRFIATRASQPQRSKLVGLHRRRLLLTSSLSALISNSQSYK
jgi:hypothetical protein